MIQPTARTILLVALAAPVGLAVGIVSPGAWGLSLLWIGGVLMLAAIDAARTPSLSRADLAFSAPTGVPLGAPVDLSPVLTRAGDALPVAFAADVTEPLKPMVGAAPLRYRAARRGTARVRTVWARMAGPMGLAWRQTRRNVDRPIAVLPDIRPARDDGMRQYLNSVQTGQRIRREHGDGQDFQVLTAFQSGMERRAIDWKASARHAALLAREYQVERDNAVVLAIDAGRAMSDPVGDLPRVDRAVSAALLAAFVALKSGDRVRLFSFAAQPLVDSGSVTGTASFTRLHHAAAAIDYGTEESNYTLGLTALDARLDRRSLIVLFTEFTDPTNAELMLQAAARMLKRHRLLFLLFDDVELETIRAVRPDHADDVVRANVAHALLRERRIVVERLRRLGAEVIEATPDAMPLALVERYVRHRERAA